MKLTQTQSLVAKFAGIALLGALPLLTQAAPLLQVSIRPIQVCDDAGLNCANPTFNLFAAETEKIWAQAEIMIDWLSWQTVNSSARLNEDAFSHLGNQAPAGVVDLWFVNNLTDCGGTVTGTLFGCGTSSGWFALTKAVFDYSTVGRLDTLAHELGHVLRLGHGDFGAGSADNLMTAGSSRSIPQLLSDINPDGAKLDKLTVAQVDRARTSGYLSAFTPIPEPGSMLLVAMAGLMLLLSTGLRGRARLP